MVELVTGPMEYYDAKYYLVKIIKFIQTYGYTNDKCSIHFNLSFDDDEKDLNDLNILKLILNTDEEEIYRAFPSRKDNVYAKTIKKIIPYKEYDFFNIPIDTIKNNLRVPVDKYYGINFSHINSDKEQQRLEFRYIGGKDYEKNIGQLVYFLDRFIINVYDCTDEGFDHEDCQKLEEYLEENIRLFKNFSKYDNLIIDFPTIQLQIDQSGEYDTVNAYYDRIYDKLYSLIDGTNELKECIVNYVTSTQTMEVVDAQIKTSATLKSYEFINCQAEGIFESCSFLGTDIKDSQVSRSDLSHSDASESKILNCRVDGSTLNNCYFMQGYLNGDMYGGVFRSGELGPYATMDSEVKIVNDNDNFFGTKFNEDPQKGKDKGIISGFGKMGGKK
jgi:hypothetical protein